MVRILPISSTRGNSVAVVVVVTFILLIAMSAIHFQQKRAMRGYSQAEATLRFREARAFALRQRLFDVAPPSGLMFTAHLRDVSSTNTVTLPENYATSLFQKTGSRWTGLPNLRAIDSAPAHRYLEADAVTGFASLRVFEKRSYRMVECDIPGYAAYAPKGSIHLEAVEGWSNPTFEEKGTSALEAFSGVPAFLGAKTNIEVGRFGYGEAHSRIGPVTIGEGAAVGFVGPLPLPEYEGPLLLQALQAQGDLDMATASGDKTPLLNGPDLTLQGIIQLLFNSPSEDDVKGLLGMRQAFNFPMPVIPGFSQLVPGLLYELWFHVPFPPDGGFSAPSDPDLAKLAQLAELHTEATAKLEELRTALESATAAREQAAKNYQNSPGESTLAALHQAQAQENAARQKFEETLAQLQALGKESEMIARSKTGSGLAPVPQTRGQDPAGVKGIFGWNYSKVMENLLGLLTDTIKGDFENIASRISTRVRLVHYGGHQNIPQFTFGNPFVARSTFTVPRGRSLRFVGALEIQGDLWLQRGSVFAVHGDLILKAPGATSPTDPYLPSGRLFLEEGATLIVRGNLTCQGTPQFGSAMVAGVPGEIHPLSAAILCDGNVHLPFGAYSGSNLEDLIGSSGIFGTDRLAPAVATLMEQGCPNVAKIAGPFHIRRPYFARFATTFHLTIIPPVPPFTLTPTPVPAPLPLPKENILVFVSRALSLAYTASLNASLGENLYPQADWWPFGTGVVPMVTRIPPERVLESITGAVTLLGSSTAADIADLETRARKFLETFTQTAMQWAIREGGQKLVGEVALMLIPGASSMLEPLIDALVEVAQGKEEQADQLFNDFVQDVTNVVSGPMRDILGGLLSKTDLSDFDNFVREHSGIFIWAGGNLTVGESARLISGMFMAGNSIDIKAQLTIGTLLARDGSVRARRLLYYPYFNQASLYVPRETPSDWVERAKVTEYGRAFDSGRAVQVGPPPVTRRIVAEGWEF